jgi:hypothetical protein
LLVKGAFNIKKTTIYYCHSNTSYLDFETSVASPNINKNTIFGFPGLHRGQRNNLAHVSNPEQRFGRSSKLPWQRSHACNTRCRERKPDENKVANASA